MTIKNLTPHTVTVISQSGEVLASFESAGVARATQFDLPDGEVDGIEVVRTSFGATENLPDPLPGTWLVVSVITANAARAMGRTTEDLLVTSGPVRGDDGSIIGCRRFARI